MPGSQDFAADPRNAAAMVSLNGTLVARREATVSIFDGGFVVGDGVWEGLRLHKGALLFLNQHLDRLYEGAAKIRLDIGLDRSALTAEIRRTLAANGMHHGVHIRLMVTRGEKSAPNQDPRNALGPATVVIVAEYKVPDPRRHACECRSAVRAARHCGPARRFHYRRCARRRGSLRHGHIRRTDSRAGDRRPSPSGVAARPGHPAAARAL
jgi:branched-chain amino acid aminotransferase